MFTDKILLITGGTGSFGNAVLKRFLKTNIKEIRIFSRDEKKQDDMRKQYKDSKIKFYVGDVRDYNSINFAVKEVDYVFHAAALKQVPSCEFFPMEAVKTNIIGTENVIEASINNEVKKVIVLSTDKAVYPINSMGLSKALMEKVMVAKSRNIYGNKTILCGTRYGNVMASRGSVIPLFIKQYKKGEPLTITDPKMTRFLMSLEEAVDLVIYAFQNGNQGDIFVQKSPASTIGDLALAVKFLLIENDIKAKNSVAASDELYFNDELLEKNNIKIIGIRHGEKLYETLLTKEELFSAIECGNYYRIQTDSRDLNYDKYFNKGRPELSLLEEFNSHNTERLNIKQIKENLLKLEFIKRELSILRRG